VAEAADGALAGIRVLDLTGATAAFAGHLLAGLGADVIKIEPPEGDPLRRHGPFARGIPHAEGSLRFAFLNANKRGITLNLASTDGAMLFRELASRADIVIETMPPGEPARLGVAYEDLVRRNRGLIWAAVTPYGQTGPRSGWKGSDISAQAMGGVMYLTGDAGKTPVRGAAHMAEKMGGYVAAYAASVALVYRDASGRGQYIDLSLQEAVASQVECLSPPWVYNQHVQGRDGRVYTVSYPAALYPCGDGWVSLVAGTIQQWTALIDWIGDERLFEERWRVIFKRFEDRYLLDEIICAWTRSQKKQVMFEEGQRRRIPVGIASTAAEVAQDPHLRERGFFRAVEHAHLGTIEMPAVPFFMSETPYKLRRAAPLLGEHNAEVYGELGLMPAELETLRAQGVI
jgi:crotonobetainyl-CoA:carnitine CoA-transferase CaiB-like acyl-CoA transferase